MLELDFSGCEGRYRQARGEKPTYNSSRGLLVRVDLHDGFEVENGNSKIIDKEWQLV